MADDAADQARQTLKSSLVDRRAHGLHRALLTELLKSFEKGQHRIVGSTSSSSALDWRAGLHGSEMFVAVLKEAAGPVAGGWACSSRES